MRRPGAIARAKGLLAALALGGALGAAMSGPADAQTLPTVTVEGYYASQAEGGPVSFELVRSGASNAAALDVNVQVSETGAMLPAAEKGRRTITIGARHDIAYFTFDSIFDEADEADSTVTVSVLSGTGYSTGTPSLARTEVTDDDLPEINVEAVSSSVREGRSAVFRITRTGLTSNAITVALDVFDNNSSVLTSAALATRSATIRAGRSSAQISLATRADNVDGPPGEAWVHVLPGDSYQTGDRYDAMVSVEDDDLPTVSVEADQESVIEGTPAQFFITRTGPLGEALTVRIAVSETGDMVDATLPRSIVIPARQDGAAFDVPTVDDSADESDGSVRVSLVSSGAYRLGGTRSVTTGITDNDRPNVTIEAVSEAITEGAAARFRFTREGVRSDTLTVPLRVYEEGDVLSTAARQISSVTFSRGSATAELRLATVNDALEERETEVSVSADPAESHDVSESASRASVTVRDNDQPVVTIRAVEPQQTEGFTARFRLTRDGLGESAITVRVSLRKQGDMFANSASETVEVAFPADAFRAELSVATVGDNLDEDDGVVYATLLSGTGYQRGTPQRAQVAVTDDDLQTVSIAGPTASVAEGSTAEFILTRDVTGRDLSVTVDYASSGGWDAVEAGSETVRFARRASTARLRLRTYDDPYDNDTDSTVHAAVLTPSDANYRIGETRFATATVTDNDTSTVLPVVSVRGPSSRIEGQDATFTLRRTGGTGYPLQVFLHVSETGDMFDGRPPTRATFARGASSATVTVRTRADETDTADSTVTLQVSGAYPDFYATNDELATDRASVVVRDNNDYVTPTVTVRRDGPGIVNEGATIRFSVSRAGSTVGRTTVPIEIKESGATIVGNRSATVTFEPGATSSQTITVRTSNDDTIEHASVITVQIKPGDGFTVGSPGSAKVAVQDDENSWPRAQVWISAVMDKHHTNPGDGSFGEPVSTTVSEGTEVTFKIRKREES